MSVRVRIRNGMEPDAGDGGVSEGDFRGVDSDILDEGNVPFKDDGHCLVHESSPSASMNIIVDPGVVYIPNDSYDPLDSDSIKFWEAVIAGTTGDRTLTISANSSGQTRHDLICIELDPGATPDEHASNIAELVKVEGTPGGGVPAVPANHSAFASIEVVNGATAIEDDDITDLREQLKLRNDLIPDVGGSTGDNVAITGNTTSTSYVQATGTINITIDKTSNVLLRVGLGAYGPVGEQLVTQLTQNGSVIGNAVRTDAPVTDIRFGHSNNWIVENLAPGSYTFGLKFRGGTGGLITIETGTLSALVQPV